MARSYKTDLAHRVFSKLKDKDNPHPLMTASTGEFFDWMSCGRRHGNNRKGIADLKTKARRARRLSEQRVVRSEIEEEFSG